MIFLLMKKIIICNIVNIIYIKYHFSGQEEKEMSF